MAQRVESEERHEIPQTHSVFIGKYRIPGYQDGDVIRSLVDGQVVAHRTKKGWSHKVIAVEIRKGRYDDIRPLNADHPVEVHLDKGEFY